MPTPRKGPRLGGSPAHQRRMLRNLATALFEHGRVTTTEARARMLRPYAEKLITKAKKGDLHARRQVLSELYTSVDRQRLEDSGELVVNKFPQHRLFTVIAPSFADRPGGYTRITKIGPRKGDNAAMAVIELVTEPYAPKASSTRQKSAPATTAPAEETAVEETPVEMTDEASPETSVVAEADLDTVVEVEGVDADAFDETEGGTAGKYAGSSVPLEDADQAPEGFPIKGNEGSMKYHTPDGQWFDQTVADVWFDTEESAKAAGFTEAGE